jgi:dipeptidyl aminopeptidase/acylaminoacyl peptidase
MAWTSRMTAALVPLAAAGGMGGTAHAAFPGANGRLVMSMEVECADLEVGSQGKTWLVSVGSGRATRLRLAGAESDSAYDSALFWGAPTFAPGGRRLAYQGNHSKASRGIIVAKADGSRPRHLTHGRDSSPAWSPQGKALAFKRSASALYVVPANGSARPRLLARGGGEFAWSPGGDQLALVMSDPDLDDEASAPPILVVGVDGSVAEIARGVDVSWPRAGWLAYRRGANLYINRSDGSAERLLARDIFLADQFIDVARQQAWSPDGRRLAFIRGGRVLVVRVPGGEPRLVGHSFVGAGAPVLFSPDGRLVAFVRDDHTAVLAPADGKGRRTVVRLPDSGSRVCAESIGAIDWQARPHSP